MFTQTKLRDVLYRLELYFPNFQKNIFQKSDFPPWRRYRIEIHSESIRTVPIHSNICIRGNANHSEPIRNQVFNPDQSELGLIQTEFSIRNNLNESKVGMIRIVSD